MQKSYVKSAQTLVLPALKNVVNIHTANIARNAPKLAVIALRNAGKW